jgi:bifunctional UDP-N-acetylglucosamine pyrophosphorylase/glucosamine-1-phosphate N-acetyltransferase
MIAKNLAVVILAAGKGSRMRSPLPKVMHKVMGLPLIEHVIAVSRQLDPCKIIVVSSPELKDSISSLEVQTVVQNNPMGTGHAVMEAIPYCDDIDYILILNGDTPGLSHVSLTDAYKKISHSDADVLVLSMYEDQDNTYGRLRTHNENLLSIVEAKDASEEDLGIKLCNSGIIIFQKDALKKACAKLKPSPITNEYYLTDIVGIITSSGGKAIYNIIDKFECQGINTQEELSAVEYVMQQRKRKHLLKNGVQMLAPETVYFSHDTVIEPGVVIEPFVMFGPNVCIKSGSVVKSFSYMEGCNIGSDCSIGPFSRLRPGTNLDIGAKVGNFVELKNAKISVGSKVNHLSYIGDAVVGMQSNIGAGVITCNYDGFSKHHTYIGDKVFVGSNVSLVAPIKIDDGVIIGAGSTITKGVDKDSLAICRSEQKNLANGASKLRFKKSKERAK